MSSNNNQLEKHLWDAADELRANSKLRSHEYSVPVLGLVFLKWADFRFTHKKKELEKKRNKTSMRELAYRLREYLSHGSKKVNVNRQGQHTKERFWFFKLNNFQNLMNQEALSLEDENESDVRGDINSNKRNIRWPGNGKDNKPAFDNGG